MAREFNLVLGEYDIGEWRYKELKAFCRQYPEMKAKADALLGIKPTTNTPDGMPRGKGTTSDPVLSAIEKRERLLKNVELIDRCARAVDDGRYKDALILNICYGSSYDVISADILPNSNRNAFFKARRKFFCLLNEAKTASNRES